jgi:RimJ/RimL family protein N-acetyltransferase
VSEANWRERRASAGRISRPAASATQKHGIEIGWAFHPRHWGLGYATEAGTASVEYAFAHHDVDALYSVILPENKRSQAVAQRLGFTLFETRITSHFPESPHGIWRLARSDR